MGKPHKTLLRAVECALDRARRDGVTRVITVDADARYHVHSIELVPQHRFNVVASCTPAHATRAV